jgi:hypothetical protein
VGCGAAEKSGTFFLGVCLQLPTAAKQSLKPCDACDLSILSLEKAIPTAKKKTWD